MSCVTNECFLREFLFKSACNAHISDIYNADLSLESCHKNNEKGKKNNVSFEILSNTIYAQFYINEQTLYFNWTNTDLFAQEIKTE